MLQWRGQSDTHFEVVWDEELGSSEEVEDVAEHVSVPVNEVVLLQTVQHNGLCAIKETADSRERHKENTERERNTESDMLTYVSQSNIAIELKLRVPSMPSKGT